MPAVSFQCPYCQTHIEADEPMRGVMINCPECGGLFRIPGGAAHEEWLLNFDCPSCLQNIEAPADAAGLNLKCPACGQLLVIPPPPAEPAAPPPGIQPAPDVMGEKEKKGSTARIELPKEVRLPEPGAYHLKIKRFEESEGSHLPRGFHAAPEKREDKHGPRG